MKEHFDPTLPRNKDLYRIKLIHRRNLVSFIEAVVAEEKKKHDEAVKLVEKLYEDLEDKPIGSWK